MIDVATPALRDSTRGDWGIATISSACVSTSLGSPAPSLPISKATGPRRSASARDVPLCDEVASTLTPRDLSSCNALANSIFSVGTRNSDPADARTAFQFHGLTVRSPSNRPVAPNASAERAIVPRFPGSCRPAITTSSAGIGENTFVQRERFGPHHCRDSLRSVARARR